MVPVVAASRLGRVLLVAIGCMVAVTVACGVAFAAPLGSGANDLVSHLSFAVIAVVMVGAMIRLAVIASGVERWAWGASVALFALLLVAYAVDPIRADRLDAFPLAFRLAPLLGLVHTVTLLVLARRAIAESVLRLALDGLWLSAGVLLLSADLIAPEDSELAADTVDRAFLAAQQFSFALFVVFLGLVLHRTRADDRATLLLCAAPLGAVAIAQLLFSTSHANGGVAIGSIEDFAMTAAFAVGTIGALVVAGRPTPHPRPLPPGAGQVMITVIPLAAWVVATELLGLALDPGNRWTLPVVSIVGAVRLAFLAWDNARLLRSVHERAMTDSLTGLPNREAVEAHVAMLGDAPAAVLLVDLDGFRSLNAAVGPANGDQLLRLAGDRIADVAGSGWLVARFAGDRFALVRDGVVEEHYLRAVGRRVVDTLSATVEIGGREVALRASAGAAATDVMPTAELLAGCEVALRQAKSEGGGLRVVDRDRVAEVAARRDIERALERAVDNEELFTLFQPKVDLVSGDIVGVEALVRWRRPGVGVVSPAEFIPIAEQTGAIARLDSWVFADAVAHLGRWNECARRRLRLSTNMSAWQLARADVDDDVRRVVAAVGNVDPAQVTVELTETVLVEEPEVVAGRLERLKAAGVGLSIDDFGAGFASVAYLTAFPVDEVKLDRALVWELEGGADDDQTLAAAVIALGRALGLRVIAEGVETVEQARALRRLGCRHAQGFLFSAPVSPEAIDEMLHTGASWADVLAGPGAASVGAH